MKWKARIIMLLGFGLSLYLVHAAISRRVVEERKAVASELTEMAQAIERGDLHVSMLLKEIGQPQEVEVEASLRGGEQFIVLRYVVQKGLTWRLTGDSISVTVTMHGRLDPVGVFVSQTYH
jgi:hypothetical protein